MAKRKTNKEKVIDLLNEARASELTAILQYMSQHYELEDADFGKLAAPLKAIAIQEMQHAEMFAERILFLGGTPTSIPDGKTVKGEEIVDLLATDMGLESGAIEMYNHHATACAELGDLVSKDLFETILAQEEDHWSQFDNVHGHIEKLGAVYLATLAGGDAEAGAAAQ
ncbi:MAG: bacterioferritin [Candidatus Brocadiae bacterium]|nr:bacterioferritin [Candidatus Brocadiia bacterium]